VTTLRMTACAVPLGLFCLSCVLTVGHGHGGFLEGGEEPAGWRLLAFGWMVFSLAWLANPLFVAAFICLCTQRYGTALVVSCIGFCLSLSPLAMFGGMEHIRFQPPIAIVFANGHLELRMGYFVWVSSQMVIAAAAFVLQRDSVVRSQDRASG
jgi:hypothetical protein